MSFDLSQPELEVHRESPEVILCSLRVIYLPFTRTGNPSRRHRKLGGEWPRAILPVLGRNRVAVGAPPEVGWGRPRAIFTCPRPEPDILRGATGSWVVGDHAPFFTCPRLEPDSRRGATEGSVGVTKCPFYLSSSGTGYPSRRHRRLCWGNQVPILPVLGRNRISIEAPPEVGWGRPRAIFTCPWPEPDIHRGATGSWVGTAMCHFTCPRSETDCRRGATGSWAGAATRHFLPVLGWNRIAVEAPPEALWG
jgi:hypothetical protein